MLANKKSENIGIIKFMKRSFDKNHVLVADPLDDGKSK